MIISLKERILTLRKKGYTYKEIANELHCSKSTISYHCKNNNLDGRLDGKNPINNEIINKVKKYYLNHTLEECSKKFNISKSTIKRHVDNKTIKLTETEKKEKNYIKVKVHRQKIKKRSVEYLGGECSKCGYNECIWALEFHHLNPLEKDFSVSRYQYLSWNKIKVELDKCILVCANCHREIHYYEYLDRYSSG